jgi:hypothetical protein
MKDMGVLSASDTPLSLSLEKIASQKTVCGINFCFTENKRPG